MQSRSKIVNTIFFTLLFIFISSCSFNHISSQEYQQNNPRAEVLFKVEVQDDNIGKNDLFIEILDEVTGLGLNPTRYQMQPVDAQYYSIRLPLTIGFSVKYRYVKGGTPPSIEFDSESKQVRYRMVIVKNPLEVNDLIAGWQDSSFQGMLGTLRGFIFNETNSEPVSNAMVIIAGMRSFTGTDGSYAITNIPAGEHYLTAYHIDGLFLPFQQKAIIAANAVTPANFGMKPAQLVDITFKVTPPTEILSGAPIRLFGDLYSLGNSFNDLQGGISSPGTKGRLLDYQADGSYSLTLSLPAGHPLEYKYSLGDGFWNAEHTSDLSWKNRRIIIPTSDVVINDEIATWKNSNENPLTFNITVPSITAQSNQVLLQLNPFVWMEPLPMWSLGNNQWMYVLYSPTEFIRNSIYRIQLNGPIGIQNDIATTDPNSTGMKTETTYPEVTYTVQLWSSNKK